MFGDVTNRFWIALIALVMAQPTPSVWAIMNNQGDPNTVDESALSAPDPKCDSFCGSMTKYFKNWSPRMDQWCADHGSQTEHHAPARQNLAASNRPEAASCPYPMLA